jgi:lipoprotein-anchoring transpeptidase ErfK/SrfK
MRRVPLLAVSTRQLLRSPRRRFFRAAAGGVLALGIGVLPTACAGSRPSLGAIAPTSTANATTSTSTTISTSTTTSTSATTPAAARPLGPSDLLGYIATPLGAPTVYAEPSTGSKRIDVPAQTVAKAPTTFAVVGDASTPSASKNPGWYQVLLPGRPNGTTGYVPTASVTVTKTPLRMFVDLAKRTLRVESDGTTTMTVPVAIGTPKNPTPTGATYVTELIQNIDPTGSYGPYAYGLALHSNTLSEFEGGDGQVGIHGTNQPRLIGESVSHGCVRLTNDNVKKLVDLQLPLGVPVFIS